MLGLRDRVLRRYIENCRIATVLYEVTHRCPCDCVHCLVTRTAGKELKLDEVVDLFAQLRAEGALNLVFTGGEPFCREDFPEILEAAHRERFFSGVLTTATLVGASEAALLRRTGVRAVEISLLGASSATHDAIMQMPGAFDRMLRGVACLRDAGLAVMFKTTVLRPNWKELPKMKQLADELGVAFTASPLVAHRTDGNPAPLQYALEAEEVAQLDPEYVQAGLLPGEDYSGATLSCLAGITTATISPSGDVFPCVILRKRVGSIREQSLRSIWHSAPDPFLIGLRALKPQDASVCAACELQRHCPRCPGVSYLETGRIDDISMAACRIAEGFSFRERGQTAIDPDGKRPTAT